MSNPHYPNGNVGGFFGPFFFSHPRGLIGADDPVVPLLFLAHKVETAGEPEPSPPTTGTLSGFVYEDRCSLGLRSPHSRGVGNVRVTLRGMSSDGRQVSVICLTSADGRYVFTGLPAGTYRLNCTIPINLLPGWVTVGRIEDRPSGTILAESAVGDISLPGGTTAAEYNFGLIRPVRLSGSAPVGVRVTLNGINDCGQSVKRVAVARENGLYLFDDLRPGIYDLQPQAQSSWLLVGRVRGSSAGWPEEGNRVVGITLRSGDEGLGYDVQPTSPPGP